jgi:UMF1 family MFS transporter
MLKSFSLQERSWIMYDWANSAYSVIISSVILPLFYKSITTGEGIAPNLADSYWGYATSAATLAIAVFAPILGTIGDYPKWKMRLFKSFFLIGVVATAALSFTDDWRLLLAFYMLTTIGFSGANIFYDAFLVDVATEERMDRVSTYGFALGYIGGSTIPFVLSILLIMFGESIGISRTTAVKASFLFTAFWWIVFTIPMLRNVKQRYFLPPSEHIIHDSFARLSKTLRQIRSHKKMFLFLIAYFFYIDGLNTIIHMAAVFGDSIGVVSDMLMIAVLVIPILSFPFTILYGKLAQAFRQQKDDFGGHCHLSARLPAGFPDDHCRRILDPRCAGRNFARRYPSTFTFLFRQTCAQGERQRIFRFLQYPRQIRRHHGSGALCAHEPIDR